MRRLGVVLTLLLLSVPSSCSGDPARDTRAVYVDTGDSDVFAPTEDSIRDRCVSETPAQAPIRDVLALGEDEATTVPAVVIGPEQTSDTVLVLMRQVGSALCGWGRFAAAAALSAQLGLDPHRAGPAPSCSPSPRRSARRIGAEFLDGGEGHGYELLTDLQGRLIAGGERVLAFARGR